LHCEQPPEPLPGEEDAEQSGMWFQD
jgi:hypothetical protein